MAINVETDDLIPVRDLVKQRLGKRLSPATLWRWRLRGVHGAKLESIRAGSQWMTTAAAFSEFLRTQTANCSPTLPPAEAPAERSAATERKLQAAGLVAR